MSTILEVRDDGMLFDVTIKGPASVRAVGNGLVDHVLMEADPGSEQVTIVLGNSAVIRNINFIGGSVKITGNRNEVQDCLMTGADFSRVQSFNVGQDRARNLREQEARLIEAKAKMDYRTACSHAGVSRKWDSLPQGTRAAWLRVAAEQLGLEAP